MTQAPSITTRKPTGKPNWPFVLVAGAEKAGKTFAWAEFSASELIGRTYVIEIGETSADPYGAIPGVRFEIVEHDGSHNGITNAAWAASKQPRVDGKPNVIVIDSGTEDWDLLANEQQAIATLREKRKQEKYGNRPNRKAGDADPTITVDQWNVAKSRWRRLIDVLRDHDGPVIITARLEEVTVMDKSGKPTTDKTMKVRAEKNLPFEVDCIVEIPRRREAYLTGARSVVLQLDEGESRRLPKSNVLDQLMRMLGLDTTETAPRAYIQPSTAAYVAEESAAQGYGPAQPAYRPAANGHQGPAQNGAQRAEQPASTQAAQPAGQQASPPAAGGPSPQVVNHFLDELNALEINDLPGWRAAYQRAGQLGIRSVEVPTGQNAERVQLGQLLMSRMRHASSLPQARPADHAERASGDHAGEPDTVPAGVDSGSAGVLS